MNKSSDSQMKWYADDYFIIAKLNDATEQSEDKRKEIHEVLSQMYHRAKKRGRPSKEQSEELKNAS